MEALRIEYNGNAVTLAIPKELDNTLVHAIRVQMNEFIENPAVELMILDMSELQTINSTGIGMLVSMKTKCAAAKKKFYLLKPFAPVLRTLEIVQLDSFFSIVESLDNILPAKIQQKSETV